MKVSEILSKKDKRKVTSEWNLSYQTTDEAVTDTGISEDVVPAFSGICRNTLTSFLLS